MDSNSILVLDKMKEAGKPLKSGELVELTGLEKKIIDKSIKALKTEGKIISPKRCFYAPAE